MTEAEERLATDQAVHFFHCVSTKGRIVEFNFTDRAEADKFWESVPKGWRINHSHTVGVMTAADAIYVLRKIEDHT